MLAPITNVSVVGVMQECDGPDEDRTGGFERSGWSLRCIGSTPATCEIPIGGSTGTVAAAGRQAR